MPTCDNCTTRPAKVAQVNLALAELMFPDGHKVMSVYCDVCIPHVALPHGWDRWRIERPAAGGVEGGNG